MPTLTVACAGRIRAPGGAIVVACQMTMRVSTSAATELPSTPSCTGRKLAAPVTATSFAGLVGCDGELLTPAGSDQEELLYADVDPDMARQKRIINIPGQYEIDRIADRRPEMYRPLCE